MANYTLWKTIKYIVDQSNLNVTLIKVKGHSGDIYNNIADDLAKSGTQSPGISINYLNVPAINCLFQFNNITVESSVRHFVKDIFAATAVSNIIDLHRNDDLKSLTRQAKINWITIWSIFTLDQATYSTSFQQRKLRSFIMKIFLGELPTLSRLEKLRPDLYKNWNCVGCNLTTETADHLWSCDAYSLKLNTIISDVKSQIIKLTSQCCSPSLFTSISLSLELLLNKHFAHPSDRISSFLPIVQGKLPSILFDDLTNLIGSSKKTNKILTTAIVALYEQLFTEIWSYRCSLMNAKELSKHITSDMKNMKKKCKHLSYDNSVAPTNTWELWIQLALTYGYKWTDF